jgi:hypothetical protein
MSLRLPQHESSYQHWRGFIRPQESEIERRLRGKSMDDWGFGFEATQTAFLLLFIYALLSAPIFIAGMVGVKP